MSQLNIFIVQIFDKEYCINCLDDECVNLESVVCYLDGKMCEICFSGKVIGVDWVVVMVVFNIIYDLLYCKECLDQESSLICECVCELFDCVDCVLVNLVDVGEV